MDPDDMPEARRRGPEVRISHLHGVVFRTVQRFGGIPLSCVDVAEETGLTHTMSLAILHDLHLLHQLNTKTGPGGTQLFYVGRAL